MGKVAQEFLSVESLQNTRKQKRERQNDFGQNYSFALNSFAGNRLAFVVSYWLKAFAPARRGRRGD